MKRTPGIPWTPEELDYLRRYYATDDREDLTGMLDRTWPSISQMARKLGLRRDPEKSLKGRFCQGKEPWNKGMKGVNLGGEATQFKKGHLGGNAALNRKPIGAYRLSKDGYLEQKVNDDMPLQRRWKAVHRTVWEAHHGPIPEGCIVVFKPGQHTTQPDLITVDRLECITRQENMRRNSITRYPENVRSTIQQLSWLKRKIKQAEEA